MLTKQYRKPAGNLYRFLDIIIIIPASLNSFKIKQISASIPINSWLEKKKKKKTVPLNNKKK